MMKQLETIKLEKHAHWALNIRGNYCVVCSNCLYGLPLKTYNGEPVLAWGECNRDNDEREYCAAILDMANYCPNCGARMDEVAK